MITGKKINNFSELVNKSIVLEIGYDYYNAALSKLGINLETNRNINEVAHLSMEHIIAVGDEIAASDAIGDFAVNLTSHRVISRVIFANNKKIKNLTKTQREIFISTLKKYAQLERQDSVEGKKLVLKLLKNRGAPFNIWSAENIQQNKKVFESLYNDFEKSHPGSVSAVEKLK